MIQYFKLDKSKVEKSEFMIISGKSWVQFFFKRLLYLVLFVYSTFFLAVAIPFFKTPVIPIYVIGAIATVVFIIRFINHTIKYVEYGKGKISFTDDTIEVTNKKNIVISQDSIKGLKLNPLGNFIIKTEDKKISFPITLLGENDRDKMLSFFEDTAINRTMFLRKIWEFFDAISVALVLAVHIIQYIVQAYYIPTGSMENTLLKDDHLFVEKVTYGPSIPKMLFMDKPVHLKFLSISKLQRGDIVIFTPPHEEDKDYIKRCIAVPGDKFLIKDEEGVVYINGKKIKEPYAKGKTYYNIGGKRNREIEGIVPPGKIIVLGDNRENSQDSRFFGYLDIYRIKGKAFILYWNTNQIKKMDFSRLGLIR
ncbi:signal peptidase I [Spirochaetota bacterium]